MWWLANQCTDIEQCSWAAFAAAWKEFQARKDLVGQADLGQWISPLNSLWNKN